MSAKTIDIDLRLTRLDTPTGRMLIVTDQEGRARAIDWDDCQTRMNRLLRRHYGVMVDDLRESRGTSAALQALERYFGGALHAIDSVATATNGTGFQQTVWAALRTIPSGRPISYGALATRIGRPKAIRAVGLANGSNPIAIIVPCHRVIGANASLTGYGGGLDRKRWLLAYEGALNPIPVAGQAELAS